MASPGEDVQAWSTTAATNATADPLINWAEGQPRASVNNSARSQMAAHAKKRNLENGSITTGGSANAQTFTSGVGYTAPIPTGLTVRLKVGVTNTGATTLNMDGIGAVTIKDQAGADIGANALLLGRYVDLLYNGTNWILLQAGGATAPFEALAYSGMQINGSFEVDQPNSGASVAVAAGTVARTDFMDGVYSQKSGTSAFSVQQTTSVFTGFTKELKLTVTTAQASIGGDIIDLKMPIEGYRVARLSWGNAAASPLTIGFWVKSSVAGTLSVFAGNSVLSAVAVSSVTITSAGVAQFVTATFPAQTTGTWLTDNGVGIQIILRIAAAGSINIVATNGNTFEMTGLILLPGSDAPSATRSPFIMRSYDQELLTCERYYQKYSQIMHEGYNGAGLAQYLDFRFKTTMRAIPTVAGTTVTYTNASALALFGSGFVDHVKTQITVTALGYGIASYDLTCDARL